MRNNYAKVYLRKVCAMFGENTAIFLNREVTQRGVRGTLYNNVATIPTHASKVRRSLTPSPSSDINASTIVKSVTF